MSSYYRGPGRNYMPNASLLHELRMIAQSFFQHRNSVFREKPQKQAAPTLLCADCYRLGLTIPAISVYGGNAVCRSHMV